MSCACFSIELLDNISGKEKVRHKGHRPQLH
jgi:hypothetical protein